MTTQPTDSQIRTLRREARQAGDSEMADACDLALSLSEIRAESEADDAGVEDSDSAAFFAPVAERLAAAEAAMAVVVSAIQAAEAMAD